MYEDRLKEAKSVPDIFELVKDIVKEHLGYDQAGLMVGMSDLGMSKAGFVGAFYSLNANTIIINKKPLRILQNSPVLHKHYLFHIMLHEYIHSVGSYDENTTRHLVMEISERFFGEKHRVSQLAANINKFMNNLTYAAPGFQAPENVDIEFISGIDRKNTDYIS